LQLDTTIGGYAGADNLTVIYDTTDIGTSQDSSATTDTGTWSLIALTKRLLSKLPGIGQKTAAASQSVIIASDQTDVPVVSADPYARQAYRNMLKMKFVNLPSNSGQALYTVFDANSTVVSTYASLGTTTTAQLETQKAARINNNSFLVRI
jgi:hypothetical protein